METKIEQTEILAELITLEIMGAIKSIAGGRYKNLVNNIINCYNSL